jgi:hypothetical protein
MAEAGNGESSSALKDEPGSSRAGSLGPGTNDDGDDDMEAVETNGNKAEDIEALKNTMVQGKAVWPWINTMHHLLTPIFSCRKVDTEEMRYGDITDDDLDRMTTDQYTVGLPTLQSHAFCPILTFLHAFLCVELLPNRRRIATARRLFPNRLMTRVRTLSSM